MTSVHHAWLETVLRQYADALPDGGFVVAGSRITGTGEAAQTKFAHANCSAPDLAIIALRLLEETRAALIEQAANADARELLLAVDRACAALSLIQETEGVLQ